LPITLISPHRSKKGRVSEEALTITVTSTPKGLRFNAPLTRRIAATKLHYVQIGYDRGIRRIHLIPVETEENAFKINQTPRSGQVNSSALWDWFQEQGIEVGTKLQGDWDNKAKAFVFMVSKA